METYHLTPPQNLGYYVGCCFRHFQSQRDIEVRKIIVDVYRNPRRKQAQNPSCCGWNIG